MYKILCLSLILFSGIAEARGRPHDKVDICHKNRHTITVDQHAVPAHLAHGDYLGECRPAPECDQDEDCSDSLFCNGVEICLEGQCSRSTDSPCLDGELCTEDDRCRTPPDCLTDEDCSNQVFCDGQELCLSGVCHAGVLPCDPVESCSEELQLCVDIHECDSDADCDDAVFCNGHEVCVSNTCAQPVARCPLDEVCDESLKACLSSEGEGEGEGEGEPSEGEGEPVGEGEGESSEGETGGEGEGENLTPRQTPAPAKQISGSAFWACTQSTAGGTLAIFMIPFLLFFRKKLIIPVILIGATTANAEALTNTAGLISSEDAVHTLSPDLVKDKEFNLSLDLANSPVTFRDQSLGLLSNAIDNQATARLSGAFRLTENIQLDASLPVAVAHGPGIAANRNLSLGLADATVGARLAVNPNTKGSQLALTLHSTLPTSFAALNGQPELGEAFPTIVPGVSARLGDDQFKFIVNMNYTARMPKQIADLRLGHTVNTSAAGFVELVDDKLSAFIEARNSLSAYPLGSNRVFSPIEAGAGVQFKHESLFGTAYLGSGLMPDVGVPLLRGTVMLGMTFDVVSNKPAPTTQPVVPAKSTKTEAPVEPPALAVVSGDEIIILKPVQFYFDSDQIKPESLPVLQSVAKILLDHKEIKVVSVEGHASSEGDAKYNLALSQRRSEAIVRYLEAEGVPTKLEAVGFGEAQPLVSNKTKAGRETNRRVEFKIIETN